MASSRGGISSSSSSSSLEELEQEATRISSIDSLRDNAKNFKDREQQRTVTEMLRREDNPFSFKHFLNKDSCNYQHAGARPKVYSTSRLNATSSDNKSTGGIESEGIYTRNPTELPDFVQDHLVIEQCYLNQDITGGVGTQLIGDVDNLPDFALNSVESRPLRHRGESVKQETGGDLPFDLTGSLERRRSRDRLLLNSSSSPEVVDGSSNFRRHQDNSPELLERINFPLDLPVPPVELSNCSNSTDRNHSPRDNVSIQKSLPDFLSDGPIRNRVIPQPESSNSANLIEPLDRRLQLENELLQRKLEIARRQNNENNRRIQLLEEELLSRRVVDHEETAHLEKAMEQVEDNLKRSTRRAVNAESAVTALKQEVKALTTEISALRAENRQLRNAVGAGYCDQRPPESDKKIRLLAGDLREAASSAESLLRQLMCGVDNLKIISSTLENIDRIEDKTKDFLHDFDDDNAAGPAL
ncbi:hypothetical protein PV325_000925 [Microctonus aethiopoides]|nr:hypothetical protein PV325_000925 [Microctonus aethiopoides]